MKAARELLKEGIAHQQAGRLDEAEGIYRRVLEGNGDDADALNLMGILCRARKKLEEAEKFIERAIELRADVAGFHNNLGNVLADQKKFGEAAEAYRRATELAPQMAEAHNNLGNALKDLERYAEAEGALRRALAIRPGWGEVLNNLAIVLKNRVRLEEAERAAREAVRCAPQLAEGFNTLGTILKDMARYGQAEAAIKHAIHLSPRYAEAHSNLGRVMELQGQVMEAEKYYIAATEFKPDYSEAFNNLGNLTSNRGLHEIALAYYRRALEVQPDSITAGSNVACAMQSHPEIAGAEIAAEFEKWGKMHAEPLRAQWRVHGNNREPERRLRVGYVSPDFHTHPVARFLAPIFAHHDRERFQIVCYSDVKTEDDVTAGLRACTDEWHSVVGKADGELAELIRSHKIDVLVDLAVHTEGNRLLVFARRPAPVQVTYLGYPGTTGMGAMDYRVTDRFLSPAGAIVEGPEKLLELRSYWCYEAPKNSPEVGLLSSLGGGGVAFGCLNNPAKVSHRCLVNWAKLLGAIEGSRLILFCKVEEDRQRIAALFGEHGVGYQRIEFVGSQPFAQYLATYNRIDIALDPFPYNGGTTSCDALWMGCPLVILRGDLAVRRSGSSLLGQIGLSELVADSEEQYSEIALKWARDVDRLAGLRASLRSRMLASPLMDAVGFTRELEGKYRAIWAEWCGRGSET